MYLFRLQMSEDTFRRFDIAWQTDQAQTNKPIALTAHNITY